MNNQPALMPVEQAIEKIIATVKPMTETEQIDLQFALGRVLACDQISTIDVPSHDNSAMDGYAVCFDDLARCDYKLRVSQRITAGDAGAALQKGTVARIFTGAPIPVNADTVIMQEDTETMHFEKNVEGIHVIDSSLRQGQHIRRQGQDITKSSLVVAKGRRLQAQDIGLLASVGITQVPVYRRMIVAVLSTGNELVEPGQPLKAGQIYNSNRYTICSLLTAMGCEVIDGGIVVDDFTQTCERLKALAARADLVVSSGGVSVGEEDYVKAAVEKLGQLSLWKLNIKPGKPLAFGSVCTTPFFGLPGNPASVLVTFCLIARPYVLASQGVVDIHPLEFSAPADFDSPKAGRRQEYLRGKLVVDTSSGASVQLYNNQSSGVLSSASWANVLVVLSPGETVVRGDRVKVIVLNDLTN